MTYRWNHELNDLLDSHATKKTDMDLFIGAMILEEMRAAVYTRNIVR